MVLAQLIVRNRLLLGAVLLRADDVVHPPFIAGSRTQHTAHQMIMTVRMGEGMKGIELIHAKLVGGNEYGAAGAKRDIAHPVSHGTRAHSRSRIVAAARRNLNSFGNPQFLCNLGKHCPNGFVALKNFGKLFFPDAADFAHFL